MLSCYILLYSGEVLCALNMLICDDVLTHRERKGKTEGDEACQGHRAGSIVAGESSLVSEASGRAATQTPDG